MRFLLLAFLLAALPAAAQERVLDFHSDIRIDADGGLYVTERIEVQVEGREIKRGILRDFPTDYRDRTGARVQVPFQVVAVSRDGATEMWSVASYANGERIRIGNPGVMLPLGRHVYEITYRTARQLGFFNDHDELYWNVNGNGWTFAMDRISADVALPAAVGADKLKLEAYTGYQGDRQRNYEAEARDGGASFRTTRPMGPQQGLTIVVMFPKGLVQEPSFLERARWWIGDNRPVLLGVAGVAVLFMFLYWCWNRYGRDPPAGPLFPRYDPPPGIGPAGVRFVNRMNIDYRCFSAGLLGLGARGFVKIRQLGDAYRVERTGKALELLPEERVIAALLPAAGSSVTLGKAHDPAVTTVFGMLNLELAKLHSGKRFSRNTGAIVAGLLIASAFGAGMILMEAPPVAIGVYAAIGAVLLLVFARLMPAYSVEGRKLEDAIEGLRLYLNVAEKDELARMKAPPQTAEEFARLLPYAVALDVDKTWADRFTVILGAAGVTAAVAGYYSSETGGGQFSGSSLASSLGGMDGSISSAATPPGSSSGSSSGGGGGSSGGGGGGGGGSGW